MQAKQPTKGPYTVDDYDLKKEVLSVAHEDGSYSVGKNWDIRGSNGLIIANVNFSTALYSHNGKFIRCHDLGEATANLNLLRASWLMRQALKTAAQAMMCAAIDATEGKPFSYGNMEAATRQVHAALLAAEGTVQP